jgi:CheY-like chemotaxis protein
MKTRIFVIEDHPDFRNVLTFYLRHMGYEIVEARDGGEGINKATSENPDVIILDLSLPDLTGVEVTSLLKQAPKTSNIRIIVLSVWSTSKWKEKALQAGASVYLLKPPSPDVLRETINRLMNAGARMAKPGIAHQATEKYQEFNPR